MSSDDDDLEEVLPTRAPFVNPYRDISPDASTSQAPLQITIRAPIAKEPAVEVQKKQKSEAESLERFVRLQAHRLHTIALLTNASIRNKWINDPLLHVRHPSTTFMLWPYLIFPLGSSHVPHTPRSPNLVHSDHQEEPT